VTHRSAAEAPLGGRHQEPVLLRAVTTHSRAHWASLDGLYAHFQTPQFIGFFRALGEVIAEPPAGTVSEVSSTKALDEAFAAAGIGG
jgi:hypothetical protein